MKPNAAPQPLPKAGATQERTLEAVGCRRLLGAVLASIQMLSPTFLRAATSPWGLGTASSCDLRQGGFSLGQPEGHLHGPVEVDGGGQLGLRLLPRAGLGVEGAEPQTAMRLQRAHAKFLGQGEGLAVVGLSLRALRGIASCRNLAEETHGIRLMAPFLALMSQRQRALGEGVCLPPFGLPRPALPRGRDDIVSESLLFPSPRSVPVPA
jgi:hypothetical protein